MIRLGMKPDMCSKKPRPLLIKFDEEHHSRKVLSGAVALKYCNNWMKKVGISPQLSKEELEVERTLRIELNRRKVWRNGFGYKRR